VRQSFADAGLYYSSTLDKDFGLDQDIDIEESTNNIYSEEQRAYADMLEAALESEDSDDDTDSDEDLSELDSDIIEEPTEEQEDEYEESEGEEPSLEEQIRFLKDELIREKGTSESKIEALKTAKHALEVEKQTLTAENKNLGGKYAHQKKDWQLLKKQSQSSGGKPADEVSKLQRQLKEKDRETDARKGIQSAAEERIKDLVRQLDDIQTQGLNLDQDSMNTIVQEYAALAKRIGIKEGYIETLTEKLSVASGMIEDLQDEPEKEKPGLADYRNHENQYLTYRQNQEVIDEYLESKVDLSNVVQQKDELCCLLQIQLDDFTNVLQHNIECPNI
jgi:hypothetical protein